MPLTPSTSTTSSDKAPNSTLSATHSNCDNPSNASTSVSDSVPEVTLPKVQLQPTNLEESTPTPSTSTIAQSQSTVDSLNCTLSALSISPTSSTTTTTNTDTDKESETTAENEQQQQEEELSPEEAMLKSIGLKSTHRPGFYIHINSPRRLRVQTKSRAFDLDRYCPHANADLLKWGVLRTDSTLRCGVHYWGFDLVKNGQCIAHPDETLNACPAPELQW